jgi:4-amino-4-deoxy-L-arabinose transferase-like glycosyltransferase
VGLVALILAVFLIRNLPWHLDDYDQAKQAFVSFEMVKDGQWWFQHTPSGRVATKPPLAGWISATLALGTGDTAWNIAWRLPPFLSALIILWLLWRSGDRLAGTMGAVLAAGAFGLNLFAPRLATLVRTDMLLALGIFLAGYMVYEKLRTGAPWDTRSRWTLFAVILASMLTKGPIIYAFLLPGLVAYWWLNRRSIDVGRVWAGWAPWFAPLLFFGVWVGVGIWQSQEFKQEVVFDEFLGRFTVGESAKHHNFGPHVYFLQILHRFAPWSVALIGLACIPEVRARVRRDPALMWLVCWALGGIIFMSLVPSKRADRIFPAIPPLCLLLAGMASVVPGARLGRWTLRRITVALVAVALLSAGGYAAYEAYTSYRDNFGRLVQFGRDVRAKADINRLAVISGKDEGMLLYTRQTSFTKADDAAGMWKEGRVDAVVMPLKMLQERQQDFPNHAIAVQSDKPPKSSPVNQYVLITRNP